YNCSQCAKCQRTMFGLILCGANPNDFGFSVPTDFYKLLFKNFHENAVMTTGVLYEWRCLQDFARSADFPFILQDAEAEKANIARFAALPLADIVNMHAARQIEARRSKYKFINTFPQLFMLYLKIRKKL